MVIIFGNVCFYSQPFFRGGFHGAHISYPYQGHVKGAGYGCSAESEHVYFLSHLFKVFLMGYTEALFLIDD